MLRHHFPTEWGFPKGRCNREGGLLCANREFEEETGFGRNDIKILDRKPMVEEIIGTDRVRYRYHYYIAIATSDKVPSIDKLNDTQRSEISDIRYFTYDEAIKHLRPTNSERKRVLTEANDYIKNRTN